ncbi:MAG: hypothetical protein U1D30_21975 [Planctomycetota bacterium]
MSMLANYISPVLSSNSLGIEYEDAYDADGKRFREKLTVGGIEQYVRKYVWDFENVLLETNGSNITQTIYTLEPAHFGNLVSKRAVRRDPVLSLRRGSARPPISPIRAKPSSTIIFTPPSASPSPAPPTSPSPTPTSASSATTPSAAPISPTSAPGGTSRAPSSGSARIQ